MQLTSGDFRHKSARRVRTRYGTLNCTAARHYLQRASARSVRRQYLIACAPDHGSPIERIFNATEILILVTRRDPQMSEKRGRGQPKFEPTQDQRSQVKLMKALGIPEDRICKTITNPRTRKPVAPMTLARAFAAELASGATEVHALVGNFILCAILGKKPALGDAIKSEQVRMTAAIFYAKTKMGWKETVVNEPANKDDKPFLVDDARQRLIDEVDRIRVRKEQKDK